MKKGRAVPGTNVIEVDFQAHQRGEGQTWLAEMAARCDEQAGRATPRVAASLRKVAAAYRAKARQSSKNV